MKRKDKDCGTCPECGAWSYWFLHAGVCTWCDHIVGMKTPDSTTPSEEGACECWMPEQSQND